MKKQKIIIKFYHEKKNYHEISKELGLDWRTVKKHIARYESKKSELTNCEPATQELLVNDIVSAPKYTTSNRSRRKLTNDLQKKIDYYLLENDKKRNRGQHKQELKKKDIYLELQKQGLDIGYTTVCNYISMKLNKQKEAFIKQVYSPGDVCEFDWGEVKIEINGQLQKLQLAVFTSAYSNYRYAYLFYRQDRYCFTEAHANFFEHLGGSFGQIVYDNTRVAVKRFVGPHEKEATETLLKLSIYYQFSYRFCNAYKGNEKGHVERSVEFIRRKAFGIKDEFESIGQANEYLLSICNQLNSLADKEGNSAIKLFKEEKGHLTPTGIRYEYSISESFRVDKYSTISYQTNRYSVPDYLVGKMIDTRIYPGKLICYYTGKQECIHIRHYTRHKWYIKLGHYLSTLYKKPNALNSSVALKQSDDIIKTIYQDYFIDNEKEFVEMLQYILKNNIALKELQQLIQEIKKTSFTAVNFDNIRFLYERALSGNQICHDQPYGIIEATSNEQLKEFNDLLLNQSID